MKKYWKLLVLIALVLATWTGNSRSVITVTGLIGWECEYEVYGNRFWATFENFCPASIEVR